MPSFRDLGHGDDCEDCVAARTPRSPVGDEALEKVASEVRQSVLSAVGEKLNLGTKILIQVRAAPTEAGYDIEISLVPNYGPRRTT